MASLELMIASAAFETMDPEVKRDFEDALEAVRSEWTERIGKELDSIDALLDTVFELAFVVVFDDAGRPRPGASPERAKRRRRRR